MNYPLGCRLRMSFWILEIPTKRVSFYSAGYRGLVPYFVPQKDLPLHLINETLSSCHFYSRIGYLVS